MGRVGIVLAICALFVVQSCDKTSGTFGTTKVLIIGDSESNLTWIDTNFVQNISGLEITIWNGSLSVPTLEELQMYDVVLLYQNGRPSQSDTIGNVAYHYVMQGGNVVMATFIWQSRTVWGDIFSIAPLDTGSCAYVVDSLGVMTDHPLTRGLKSLTAYYRGGVTGVQNGGQTVASWAGGDPLIVHNKPNGRIVAVTLFPAEPSYENHDYTSFYRLWENVFLYAAWGDTRSGKDSPILARPSVVKTPAKSERPAFGTGER